MNIDSQKWEVVDGALEGIFLFDSFAGASSFLVEKIVGLADRENHHPDISIYGYNKLKIRLYTHDQNAITQKDRVMAKEIQQLYEALP